MPSVAASQAIAAECWSGRGWFCILPCGSFRGASFAIYFAGFLKRVDIPWAGLWTPKFTARKSMVWLNSIKKLLLHWGLIAPANKASWQNGWKLNPRHDVRFTPLKSREITRNKGKQAFGRFWTTTEITSSHSVLFFGCIRAAMTSSNSCQRPKQNQPCLSSCRKSAASP